MILVRLDPKRGATAMMSLPRDLLVDIPGHGRDKLNAAFSIGEDALTLRRSDRSSGSRSTTTCA